MLVFIDESGHPRPSDSATRPVILATCIKESDAGRLARGMFALRRGLLSRMTLTKDEEEGKAVALLNRHSLIKGAAKREYAESLFEMLRDFELAAFAVVMERPARPLFHGPNFLQTQYRWLLERIHRFTELQQPEQFAIPIFDGQDPVSNRKFSDCFTNFMMKTAAGQSMRHIVPSPLFVDSSLTPGIQVADLFAYVTRLNHEHRLYQKSTIDDPYLSAIKRFANIVKQKTVDYDQENGMTWYGIATMDSGKFVYPPDTSKEAAPTEPPAEEASEKTAATDSN